MNNSSSEVTDTGTALPTERPFYEVITYGVLLSFIIVFTISGNALVLLSFCRERKLRIAINYPIISLAISDLFLGILVLPFSAIYTVSFNFPFGGIWCNIYICFDVMLCTASVWNITAISVDRYFAVKWPMEYRKHISTRKILTVIAVLWVIAAITSFIPIYLGWNTQDGSLQNTNQTGDCYLAVGNLTYSIILSMIDFIIPLVILLFTYIQVLVIARYQARLINPKYGSIQEQATLNTKELKATIMLSAVIAAYILCWILYIVIFTIKPFLVHVDTDLDLTALWLGYLNSTANPIVYAATNSKFRRAFKSLICPRRCVKQENNNKFYTEVSTKDATLTLQMKVMNGNSKTNVSLTACSYDKVEMENDSSPKMHL